LSLVRPLDDPRALADALLFLGVVTMLMGDYPQASQFIDESLAISRAFSDQWMTALCLSNLGIIAHMLGDYPEAYHLFHQSLEKLRVVGDPYLLAFCLNFFGALAKDMGQYAEAEDLIGEGLAIAQMNEDRWGIATAFNQLGLILHMQGEARREEARDLFSASIIRFKELGDHWSLAQALNNMGKVTVALGDESAARHYYCDAIRMAMETHTIPIVLEAMVGIAGVLAVQNGIAAEQALEVLTQILHHSAASQETKDHAERLRAELESQLTPLQIEATEARAHAKSLESLAQEILAEG
jgi:tetratricopeptide (TPR) repeat protein